MGEQTCQHGECALTIAVSTSGRPWSQGRGSGAHEGAPVTGGLATRGRPFHDTGGVRRDMGGDRRRHAS